MKECDILGVKTRWPS